MEAEVAAAALPAMAPDLRVRRRAKRSALLRAHAQQGPQSNPALHMRPPSQLRMSKKIAQLTKVAARGPAARSSCGQACQAACFATSAHLCNTANMQSPAGVSAAARPPPPPPQVIYHLNNRNEDMELELQDAAERADSAAAAAKADAAAKTAAARQQLQEALDGAKAAEERHREEVSAAAVHWDAARRVAAEREAGLRADVARAAGEAAIFEERAEALERRLQEATDAAERAARAAELDAQVRGAARPAVDCPVLARACGIRGCRRHVTQPVLRAFGNHFTGAPRRAGPGALRGGRSRGGRRAAARGAAGGARQGGAGAGAASGAGGAAGRSGGPRALAESAPAWFRGPECS